MAIKQGEDGDIVSSLLLSFFLSQSQLYFVLRFYLSFLLGFQLISTHYWVVGLRGHRRQLVCVLTSLTSIESFKERCA